MITNIEQKFAKIIQLDKKLEHNANKQERVYPKGNIAIDKLENLKHQAHTDEVSIKHLLRIFEHIKPHLKHTDMFDKDLQKICEVLIQHINYRNKLAELKILLGNLYNKVRAAQHAQPKKPFGFQLGFQH